MRAHVVLAFAGLTAISSTDARADDGELRMRGSRTAAITVSAATSWLTLELLRNSIVDNDCRWCDSDGPGSSELNFLDKGMRSKLLWNNPGKAALGSNLALYGGAMGATLGLTAISAISAGKSSNVGEDMLIIAESTFLALTVNTVSKIAFQRQRPYAHAATMSGAGLLETSADDNLSFFSGHTTLAFSLAVSAGTVASMRDYDLAPLIWGVGLTSAAATGYLRIAADKHYTTDVLVGAAVGSVFGFAVPYFLHGKRGSGDEGMGLTGAPTKGGGILMLSGLW